MPPTEIWVAIIGFLGTLATVAATIFGIMWKHEKGEAKKDRATAEEMRSTFRFEISLQDSVSCSHPSCPTATRLIVPTAVPAGSPTSASPESE